LSYLKALINEKTEEKFNLTSFLFAISNLSIIFQIMYRKKQNIFIWDIYSHRFINVLRYLILKFEKRL